MLEFIIGIIIGSSGIWFTAINKHRFTLYQAKFDVYIKINQKASELLIFPYSGVPEKDIRFSILQSEMFDVAQGNSIIVSNDVLDLVSKYTKHDLIDKGPSNEEVADYISLIKLLKNDLGIATLNIISNFLISPQKSRVSKEAFELIKIKKKQLQDQVSKLPPTKGKKL